MPHTRKKQKKIPPNPYPHKTESESEQSSSTPPPPPPPLPPAIWARILSQYCSHEELRNCLAASKNPFYDHVPPLMERLYIFHAAELNLEYARKFPNVKEVFVYSLCRLLDDIGVEDGGFLGVNFRAALCTETARNVVPFLEQLNNNRNQNQNQQLRLIVLGGYTPHFRGPGLNPGRLVGGAAPYGRASHADLPYLYGYEIFNAEGRGEEYQVAFRQMLQQFCEAFRRGSLRAGPPLGIYGLFDVWPPFRQLDCFAHRCQLCPQICETFDPKVVSNDNFTRGQCCMDKQDILMAILRRHPDFFKRNSQTLLEQTLAEAMGLSTYGAPRNTWKLEFKQSDIDHIQFLIQQCGADPKALSTDDVKRALSQAYHKMSCLGGVDFDGTIYMTRKIYEAVQGLGFAMPDDDVDDSIQIVP